jgi:catechol 2,3-dioxygenase-like lactoylglutathione lyase family enzyme
VIGVLEYDMWKKHLADHAIEILQEVRWERGLTFYFHDPDGNLLEIANADIWPR